MVRERAVELAVHHLERDLREPLEHRRHDEAAHAVGGVGDDTHGTHRRGVDERHDVIGERTEQIAAGRRARPRCRRRTVAVEHVGGNGLDLGKAGVLPDGAGTAEAELHAVVLRRVVRGGEHRPGRVERAGGEVHEVGGHQAEVDDVDALLERRRAANASTSSGPDGRMSRPTSTRGALAKRAKPTPSAWATSALN